MLAKRLARRGVGVSGVLLGAVLSQQSAWASVPTMVISSTIKAASLMAAGQAVAGVIPVKVAALTEGVLKAMFVTKIKSVLAVGLVVLVCIGGSVAVMPMVMGKQPDSPKKSDDKKQATDEKKQAEAKEAAVKAMRERLQGTWKCVSVHTEGKKGELDLILTINGNTWEEKVDGRMFNSGTYKLVELGSSPKQIDFVITSTEAEEDKGKTYKGVFMHDGNSLMMCFSKDARPQGFFTERGDICISKQYERSQAK